MAHGIHGGFELHLQLLAEGLAQRGHELHVVTTGLADRAATTTQNGVTYHFLPTKSGKFRPKFFQSANQFVRKNSFDLLWGQGWSAESVARLDSRPPLVSILHGSAWGELVTRLRQWRSPAFLLRAPLMAWRHLFWRAHMTKADHLIAVSHEVAREVAEIHGNTPLTVIPNGVDVGRFTGHDRAQTRAKFGIAPNVPLLLGVGRMTFEKGFQLAISAVERLPKAHLLLVGDGADLPALRAQAAASPAASRITLTGYLTNSTLPAIFSAADVCLLPTLRNEGLPITLIEAMASGTPVVATDIGGISTALDDGINGLLFPMWDVDQLVRQVERILDDAKFGRKLAHNAHTKVVEQFSLKSMIDQTEAIFIKSTR